ncbi:MAG: hypothetical protein OXD29_04625 [Roseovarius sp.]|nr:hypothetical protein [Roseovarius sp.]MCY4207220.1 hypothetical protein [Roseovarius sp.]MCY4315584.1 hypothetical protein [Roseovarius sp.]
MLGLEHLELIVSAFACARCRLREERILKTCCIGVGGRHDMGVRLQRFPAVRDLGDLLDAETVDRLNQWREDVNCAPLQAPVVVPVLG